MILCLQIEIEDDLVIRFKNDKISYMEPLRNELYCQVFEIFRILDDTEFDGEVDLIDKVCVCHADDWQMNGKCTCGGSNESNPKI